MTELDSRPANEASRPHQGNLFIEALDFDEFELGLLPLMRHFLASFETPALQSWGLAYAIAVERWGETIGLTVAHRLQKVIRAVLEARNHSVSFHDPLTPASREFATRDEVSLLLMLRHMRRDETAEARDAVYEISSGKMDPRVIRAGLAFASRFSCGVRSQNAPSAQPVLRVVS